MGRGKRRRNRNKFNKFIALEILENSHDQNVSELISRAKDRATNKSRLRRDEDRENATTKAKEDAYATAEVFIPRLPKSTTCTDIVNAILIILRRYFPHRAKSWHNAHVDNPNIRSTCPVINCEIKNSRRGDLYATVLLEGEDLANLLKTVGRIVLGRFYRKVLTARNPTLPGGGNAWRTHPDPGSERWKVQSVQVGRAPDELTFATLWESSPNLDISQGCMVEINPVTHVVAITIGHNQTMLKGKKDLLSFVETSAMLRIELPFRCIRDASFGEFVGGLSSNYAAFISLSSPPRLFRSESPALDLMAPILKNTGGPSFWYHKVGYVPEIRWVRTVDPTANASFSRSTSIRLLMSKEDFTSFYEKMHKWCLTQSRDPIIVARRTIRDMEKQHAKSLFAYAKRLDISFELRYSAACVFSFGRVNLKNFTREFWRTLAEDMEEDDVRLVLRAMYEECASEQASADDVDPVVLLRQCMAKCKIFTEQESVNGVLTSTESSSDELESEERYSSSSEATENLELARLIQNLKLDTGSRVARNPRSLASTETESTVSQHKREANNLTYVRRLIYTPTRCLALPPEEDLLNRVLRKFSEFRDRFLRVSFKDEDLGSVSYTGSHDLFTRIRIALRDGIEVAGERFVFLSFSNSQLRDHGVWMYNETPSSDQPPSANAIRRWMGDFSHIRVPAKFAARQGQVFSSAVGTIVIDEGHQSVIDDVYDIDGRYNFSDGVGTISSKLGRRIARRLRLLDVPSVFQIRFGGAKGVLAVWDQALPPGIDVTLRPSMQKFQSAYRRLEIVGHSKRLPFYLNRQVITILSTMGVPDEVFELKQKKFLHQLNLAMDADGRREALKLLYTAGHSGSGVKLRATAPMMDIARFFQVGLTCVSCEHLFNMMNAFRRRVIRDVLFKARVPIESTKGVCLFGVMDELGVLQEDEVFCQFTKPGSGKIKIVTGNVFVGRSPCLHPGDIQFLRARDHSCLRHLRDTIVFPRRGSRPIPSMLSGGDLDGDIYFCLFDEDFFHNIDIRSFESMKYTPEVPVPLDRKVETGDVASFFVDYLRNDRLGQIATAHLVYSDKSGMGVQSAECLKLARLHSTAVDFAKTGVPAQFPRDLVLRNAPGQYPDFLGKNRRVSYKSGRVLGKMYRACSMGNRDPLHDRPFTPNARSKEIDAIVDAIAVDPEMLQKAETVCKAYNDDLDRVMEEFGVQTEGEVISGEVLTFTERHAELKARKDFDLRTRLNRKASELRSSYQHKFYEGLPRREHSKITEDMVVRACTWHKACRKVARADRANGVVGKVSFPWVVADVLLPVIQFELQSKDRGKKKTERVRKVRS